MKGFVKDTLVATGLILGAYFLVQLIKKHPKCKEKVAEALNQVKEEIEDYVDSD